MMKKERGKIISLVVTVVLCTFMCVGVSYAWFTNNQKTEVNNINIKARVSEKIMVSTDAIKWRTAITLEDIENAQYVGERKNQIPTDFRAFSTVGNLDNGFLKMYNGFVSIDKNVESLNFNKMVLTSARKIEEDGYNGGFLTYDLYFKSDTSRSIYLGKKSYANYVKEESGIANSLRVAFIKEGSTSMTSSIETIQNLQTDLDKNVVIWEPNYNKHTAESIKNAKETYNLDITDNYEKLNYYGIKEEITEPVLLNSTDENYFSLIDNTIGTPSDYNKTILNKFLFNIDEGITKIRVYAWIEGQDVDCENSSAGTDFEFYINFTTRVEES